MATHPEPKSEADGPLTHVDRDLALMFERHASFVWRVLQLLGVPRGDVDDALQEVFLIVMRKLPEYEERGGEKAWLFTIARQVASHARRATQRRVRRERGDELTQSAPEDPHSALERSEAARFVETFLSKLDERQATVFHLTEVEGMSAPEIADCLGVGVNTVYSRLRLAREQFERALLRQRGQESRWNR